MAASSILLRRPSACLQSLIGGASQFYCGSASTAAKRSHVVSPICVSSARRFSSSSSPLNSDEPTAGGSMLQQPANIQPSFNEIVGKIDLLWKEIELLRKEREGTTEVVVVKEKHPLHKIIELEMSKSEELNLKTRMLQLPHGFEVENDKPGAATVTLKGKHEKEIISIELSIPAFYVMLLNVKVTLPGPLFGILDSTEAVFQCAFRNNGFQVEKIKEPNGTDILFYNLPQSLKDEFQKYLKVRGVYEENVIMLYKYMYERTNRENLRGLQGFKKMVQAAN